MTDDHTSETIAQIIVESLYMQGKINVSWLRMTEEEQSVYRKVGERVLKTSFEFRLKGG